MNATAENPPSLRYGRAGVSAQSYAEAIQPITHNP